MTYEDEDYDIGYLATIDGMIKASECLMCKHWDDDEGDFCDYLSWRYGLEFGNKN
jgi:hypothetical protein